MFHASKKYGSTSFDSSRQWIPWPYWNQANVISLSFDQGKISPGILSPPPRLQLILSCSVGFFNISPLPCQPIFMAANDIVSAIHFNMDYLPLIISGEVSWDNKLQCSPSLWSTTVERLTSWYMKCSKLDVYNCLPWLSYRSWLKWLKTQRGFQLNVVKSKERYGWDECV